MNEWKLGENQASRWERREERREKRRQEERYLWWDLLAAPLLWLLFFLSLHSARKWVILAAVESRIKGPEEESSIWMFAIGFVETRRDESSARPEADLMKQLELTPELPPIQVGELSNKKLLRQSVAEGMAGWRELWERSLVCKLTNSLPSPSRERPKGERKEGRSELRARPNLIIAGKSYIIMYTVIGCKRSSNGACALSRPINYNATAKATAAEKESKIVERMVQTVT